MSFDEFLERVDQQIAEKAERGEPKRDRRVQDVPVAEDRRSGKERRGAPRAENYKDSESYNKAYDRWAENQR